jgi:hypothetical protein
MMELMDDMQWRFLDNPKILVPPLTPDWAYVVGREKPLGYSISLRTISLRVFNNNDDEHIHVIEIFVVHFFVFVFQVRGRIAALAVFSGALSRMRRHHPQDADPKRQGRRHPRARLHN